MSFTCTVLPLLSVFHNSTPVTPSLAEKYKALLKTVSPETRETAPTRTVLPAISVFHSSAGATPSSAEKYRALLNTVKPDGAESAAGLTFFTCTVLPALSVFHNSKPVGPSSAEKYKALLNTLKPDGEELKGPGTTEPAPGAMSITCTVPVSVPSVFHSSRPVTPSSAEKYRALLNTVKPLGEELAPAAVWLMSFTRRVPPGVPSLFHSSVPLTPSSAEKNQAPLKKANSVGKGVPLAPGKEFPLVLMSFTRVVPVPVPSVLHNSMPVVPSLAANSMRLGAGAFDWAPPPPQPASANADAHARAPVALHNGPIGFSSRWIMAPTFHPSDR